jgi:short-subunit dehydrogenase
LGIAVEAKIIYFEFFYLSNYAMKRVVIIGGSSGLGRQLALQYAHRGHVVGVTGRRGHLLAQLERDHELITGACMDVTQPEAALLQLTHLVDRLGGMDLLVYSAGIGEFNPHLKLAIDTGQIHTNIVGCTAVLNYAYRYFSKQSKGHLVLITSFAGLRGGRLAPVYHATKAYQINYLEGLRQKGCSEKAGIHFTDIRPGFVDTAMAKGESVFWLCAKEKAASQMYKAIERKRNLVYISRRWVLLASVVKILPIWLHRRL